MTVTGHPTPDIRWSIDGRDVTNDNSLLLEAGENRHKLTIKHSEVKHEGTYTITASNDTGVTTKDVAVNVTGKLQLLPSRPFHRRKANTSQGNITSLDGAFNLIVHLTVDLPVLLNYQISN